MTSLPDILRSVGTLLLASAASVCHATPDDATPHSATQDEIFPAAADRSSVRHGWSVRPGAGYSIGGLVPTPMPAEIREILHYSPVGGLRFGADFVYHVDERFGLSLGAYFSDRGMDTEARVQGYHVSVDRGGQHLEGVFWGTNTGHARQSGLYVPIAARYTLGRFTLAAGPYLEYFTNRRFSGTTSDGYLRVGNPTGDKVLFGPKGQGNGSFDFSDNLRDLALGVHFGGEYALSRRFVVVGQLSWGLSSAFESGFTTIPMKMHPFALTLGVNYVLSGDSKKQKSIYPS